MITESSVFKKKHPLLYVTHVLSRIYHLCLYSLHLRLNLRVVSALHDYISYASLIYTITHVSCYLFPVHTHVS